MLNGDTLLIASDSSALFLLSMQQVSTQAQA
jgi:hypothetical protein